MVRIVYLGSPDFAVPPLAALAAAGYEIAAVVTQPDKPRSRGRLQPTPVKQKALDLGIPVLTPQRIKTAESVAALRALAPELMIVVAYGQILSREILQIPQLGAVNIHASLLPAYRGAAPIHWAIRNGEKESGVTLMYLDEGMDTGDMICSAAVPIAAEETTGELHDRLCALGTELLLATLPQIASGTAPRMAQQEALASYAPLLKKEHELVDWQCTAQALHDQIRGMDPWPGTYTFYAGKRLKLWQSRLLPPPPDALATAAPGEVAAVGPAGIWVRCGDGLLCLQQLQPEGKTRMDAAAFLRGNSIQPGDKLG